MLIEFSVSNFRSIRERQTLSMAANARVKRKKANVFSPDVTGERLPDLLKVAAIYVLKDSIKSSLINAVVIFKNITNLKPHTEVQKLPLVPFSFDSAQQNEPSRFEVHFIAKNQRYQFELAATQERIFEERLIAFPKGKES